MSSSELLVEPKRRRKRRTVGEKIEKQIFKTGRKLRKAFGGAEFEQSDEEMEGGAVTVSRDGKARCCFNSRFCKASVKRRAGEPKVMGHYERAKPAGYKTKYELAKQAVTPPYKSVAQLRRGGSYGGKRPAEEEVKETIRNIIEGLSPEEATQILLEVDGEIRKRKRRRKQGITNLVKSMKLDDQPPPPPPPSAPAIPVGSGRPAKTAQQHAQEAIAQIQALLGVVAEAEVTPREALKDLGKAKYKQTKYETAVKKDRAYTASTGVERPRKAESPWIAHVKAYAQANGVSYKQALKDASPSYRAR